MIDKLLGYVSLPEDQVPTPTLVFYPIRIRVTVAGDIRATASDAESTDEDVVELANGISAGKIGKKSVNVGSDENVVGGVVRRVGITI